MVATKKKSTFANMTLTLFVVTALSAIALGTAYIYTKGPIEAVKEAALKASINLVVPGADAGAIRTFAVKAADSTDGTDLDFFEVSVNGERVGTAIKSYTTSGFGGYFDVIVGFDADGAIIDSNILSHSETPGLGDKADKSKSTWNAQFAGQNPAHFNLAVRQDGGDVDAITAATITSRAYVDALQRAYQTFVAYYGTAADADTADDDSEAPHAAP